MQSIWNFDVYDFFAFITPGFLVLALAYPFVPGTVLGTLDALDGTVVLTGMVLVSYVLGQFARLASQRLAGTAPWDHREHPFVKVANGARRYPSQERFFERGPDFFEMELPEKGTEGRTNKLMGLYYSAKSLLLADSKNGSGRVEKFHSLYLLFFNSYSVFFLFALVYLVVPIVIVPLGLFASVPAVSTEYILLVVGLFGAAGLSRRLASYYYFSHVQTLITEFDNGYLQKREETMEPQPAESATGQPGE